MISKVRGVAYALDLLEESGIYNVFHVSCIKRALRNHNKGSPNLPPPGDNEIMVLQLERIIKIHEKVLRNRDIRIM